MVAIAQVVESFAYGTAKSVRQLCELLSAHDRVTVFYGQRQGTELDLANLDPAVQWRPLPGEGKSKHVANLRFLQTALADGFDIIHGHSSYGGLYCKLLGPRLGVKTLYSPRGYAFLRADFPALGRWGFRQVERLTARRCLTVCCGPYEHELARELGGETIRINNGFKVQRPSPVSTLDDFALGVGRICHQKGFDIFVEIARRLPGQRFMWVGDVQSRDSSLLENLPSNLTMVSYLPHGELLDLIKAARMILLPSRWEGLSRFLIESVCLGKAIVTSRFPANLDCLDGSETQPYTNGYACQSINDYTVAVSRLGRDDECLETMQVASHRYASQNFDIQKITEQWRELYRSCPSRSFAMEQPPVSSSAGCLPS